MKDQYGLDEATLDKFITSVLAEDVGNGDITSRITVPESVIFQAALITREPIIVAGIWIAARFFRAMDASVKIEAFHNEGDHVTTGSTLMQISGNARAMLAAERSALNSLCHLSGIATLTGQYVAAIEGTGCVLLDTRKTTPGLRALEKFAARAGGATNHRMRLDDGILIKDNHVRVARGIGEAVARAKAANTGLPIQAEVDLLEQIEPALAAGADRILCDNMTPAVLADAVRLIAGRVPIEASGGIRLENIREYAQTGVDFVSVGRITQSASAADIGLDYSHS